MIVLSILQVLQQVDNKFIACVIDTRNEMDKKEGKSSY